MLPNFVVIGTTKGGTTSLYQYLRTHPDIFLPTTKELCFFVLQDNWHRGREWYEGNFEGVDREVAIGEVSPCYSLYPYHDGVPERMSALIPAARLVYVVRHPVERILSHYLEHVANGRQRHPITKVLWEDPRYVAGSRYALQIERYLDYFPRDRLLVVTTEALKTRREETLARIFAFLHVDPTWRHESMQREFYRTSEKKVPRPFLGKILKSKLYARIASLVPGHGRGIGNRLLRQDFRSPDIVIPPEMESRLRDALAPDVERLYPFVEGPFDGWGIA